MTDETAAAPQKSLIWFMKEVPIFREQTDSFYNSADKTARIIEFRRNDTLELNEEPGRHIYILMEGQIKLRTVSETGKEIILDVLGEGDAFGPIEQAVGMSAEDPGAVGTPTEAVALSEGAAMRFRLEYFQELVQRRPTVVMNISRVLGSRQKRLEVRLKRMLYRTSLGKVAGVLSELAERYGEKTDDGIKLGFRLRHQELAALIGTKRETVSECLAELELRELIAVGKGSRITILRAEDLDRIP